MLTSNIPSTQQLIERDEYRQTLSAYKSQTNQIKRNLGGAKTDEIPETIRISSWLNSWSQIGEPLTESISVGTLLDFLYDNGVPAEKAERCIDLGLALNYLIVEDSDRGGEQISHRLPHRRDSQISLADPWERPDIYVTNQAMREYSTRDPWEEIFSFNDEAPTSTITLSDVSDAVSGGAVRDSGSIYAESQFGSKNIKNRFAKALIAIGKHAGILKVTEYEDGLEISTKRLPIMQLFDSWDAKTTEDTETLSKEAIISVCHGRYEGYHGYTRFGTLKLKNLIYQPEGVDGDHYLPNRPTDDSGPAYQLDGFSDWESIVIYPAAGETPPEWDAQTAVENFISTCCTVASSIAGEDSFVEFDTAFTVFDRWLTLNDLDVPAFDATRADNMRKGEFGELVQASFPVEKKQQRTGDGRVRVITPLELTEGATQLLDSK